MKNLVTIVAIVLIATSCDNSQEEPVAFYNYIVGLELQVVNSMDEDVLNPEHSNHIDTSNIKLFYEVGGILKEVYDANLDSPRHYSVFKHGDGKYRLAIGQNDNPDEVKSKTIVQWSSDVSDRDTFEVQYERNVNSLIPMEIWLNGESIWNWNNRQNQDPEYTLKK